VHVRTGVLIKLGLVEVVDDFGDRLGRPVPLLPVRPALGVVATYSSTRYVHLKVTSDEELATHIGGLCVRNKSEGCM